MTGLHEGLSVLLPALLVKIGGEEPALVRTLPALDPGLAAEARRPLIGAGRSVALPVLLGIHPESGIDILPAPEEFLEQGRLLLRQEEESFFRWRLRI